MADLLVISAIGQDQPGIVDAIARAILESGNNIVDSRMTVLGGEFAIILLIAGQWNTLTKLEDSLPKLEKQWTLTITTKRTSDKAPAGDLLPYAVEVVALDHPGIVHHLANFFSTRNINIQDLVTNRYAAAHTGSPMFSVNIVVNIPADCHISSLREQFTEFCDELNLDAIIEPLKG